MPRVTLEGYASLPSLFKWRFRESAWVQARDRIRVIGAPGILAPASPAFRAVALPAGSLSPALDDPPGAPSSHQQATNPRKFPKSRLSSRFFADFGATRRKPVSSSEDRGLDRPTTGVWARVLLSAYPPSRNEIRDEPYLILEEVLVLRIRD